MLSQIDAIAYTCGLCGPPNPGGPTRWGFVIQEGGATLIDGCGCVAAGLDVTNHVVEYIAVGKAVQAYRALERTSPLVVRTTSRLVVSQMTGMWPVRQGAYVPVFQAVRTLVASCAFEIRWEYLPLSKNILAAGLANSALQNP